MLCVFLADIQLVASELASSNSNLGLSAVERQALTKYTNAVNLYKRTVRRARSPLASAECGYLLLQRCGLDKRHLTPLDDIQGFPVDSLVHLGNWYLRNPLATTKTQGDLLRLAVKAFGRVFRFIEERTSLRDEDLDEEIAGATAGDRWMVLDGLSIAFKELGDWNGVKQACLTFLDHWEGDVAGEGYQELYARCQEFLREALANLPGDRNFFGSRCSVRYADIWESLPDMTREYLVDAVMSEETLGSDRDWSAVVNDYAKAVESLLRDRLGKYLDENPNVDLSRRFGTAVNGRRKWPVHSFRNLSLSTFKDALQKIQAESSDPILKRLGQHLRQLVLTRTRAAHSADEEGLRKVSRDEAERAKGLSQAILRLLASWPTT